MESKSEPELNSISEDKEEKSESQDELWNEVEAKYIQWGNQEMNVSDLLNDFILTRKGNTL